MKYIGTTGAWVIPAIGASLVVGIMTIRYLGHRKDIPFGTHLDRSPFHSIVLRDGAIVATLPPRPTWLVTEGAFESRLSKPEESFTMHAGSVIRLSQRHSGFQVTAQIAPTAGLIMESTLDARSFGDGVTKITFFVTAK